MNYAIIKKYLSGNATEKEVEEFFMWIEASPENKSIFIEYKKIWALSSIDTSDQKKTLQEIRKKISSNKRRRKTFFSLKYAAIFIGLICSVSLTYIHLGNGFKTTEQIENQITLELEDGSVKILNKDRNFKIVNKNGLVVGEKEVGKLVYSKKINNQQNKKISYNILTVPYGNRYKIELSDGTLIQLNAGSRLKYPVEFLPKKSRKVYLEGEAYFSVTKNENDAFIVNTDGLNTQVFGTEFNVSSYENDENTNIVLVEGSIGVYSGKDAFDPEIDQYIKPNEMASYHKAEKSLQVKEIDITSHIAWVEGVLFFKNEPFHNILNKLERHYDVEITNNLIEMNNQRFTGMFRIENIDEVLRTFKKTSSFEYEITNSNIIINP